MDEIEIAYGLRKAIIGAGRTDPYSIMAGPQNLDRFVPSAPLVDPGELGRVLDSVDKAVKDKQSMAQIFEALKTIVGIAAKFAVVTLFAACVGCTSTPPSIAQAHAMEGDSAALYRSDVLRYLLAQEADLRAAYDLQADLIRDYELRLSADAGGKIDLARVTDLLAGAKAARSRIEAQLLAARAKLEQSEANWRISAEIHARVQSYLTEATPTLADATKLISEVAGMRARGAAQPAEEVRP